MDNEVATAIERSEHLLYEATKSARPQDVAVVDAHRILMIARNRVADWRRETRKILEETYAAFKRGEIDKDSEVGGLVLDLARYAEGGRVSGLANVRLARDREPGTCHLCFEEALSSATLCDRCAKDARDDERESRRDDR